MLLTASIWYCEEDEKNNRLDKLLSQLNGYEFMEEYLLNFIFLNIYKSASIYYLVKFFMIYYKMVGYVNYYLLSLLTDKIQNNSDETEYDNEIKNNKEVKRDLVYSKRYLISPEYNFDNEVANDEKNPDNNIQDIDELIFCSEQVCPKCKEICNIDVNKIPEIHMDLEPLIANIGNLNLSEQAHHINPSTNIVQINEDENNKEEEPTNPEQTGNDIENINNLDLLIPNYGGGEEKLNFYPELANVESNRTISSHHYTEHITTEFSEQSSHQTQIIELDDNTADATKKFDSH